MFVVIAVIVIVAVVGITVGGIRQVKRRQSLASTAAARGWRFVEREDSLTRRFAGQPFDGGRHESCGCVIRGQIEGYQFTSFEYSYQTTGYTTTSDNQQQQTVEHHNFWVVALEGFAPGVPVVSVSHKGLIRKVGSALGFTGYQTGDAAFDAAYVATVQRAPQEVLDRLLVPAVRAATIAGAGSLGGDGWRLESGALLTWFGGRTRLERIDGVVHSLAAICAAFPDNGLGLPV